MLLFNLFIKLPNFNNCDSINDVMQYKEILKISVLKMVFKDFVLTLVVYDWD